MKPSSSHVILKCIHHFIQDIVEKINEKVHECCDKGHIDEKTREYLLLLEGARPGRLICCLNCTKPECLGTPVISGCSTPRERTSEFVDNNLRWYQR